MILKRLITIPLIALLVAGLVWLFSPITQTPLALSGSDFKAGRIIDNAVFYNSNTMTVSQIQSFLNARLANCDTNGAINYGSYHYNSTTGRVNHRDDPLVTSTRAVYGQRVHDWRVKNGWSDLGSKAPYICLKDYSQTIPSLSANSDTYCKGSFSGGTASSARIIHDVAKACAINPQVLIVLLQKEQSLVTDDWPWGTQYEGATGYACPDTSACDPAFAGFYHQVWGAARQYQIYKALPNSFQHIAGQNNIILWHPNTSCGSSTVFIENQATAGLYNYTPYRPNQAALDNLYDLGDACSSYGNRNFWRLFNDWFGPSIVIDSPDIKITSSLGVSPTNAHVDESVTATFTIENQGPDTIFVGRTKVVVRDQDGNNHDFFSSPSLTMNPGDIYNYAKTKTFPNEGNYTMWLANYRDGIGWSTSFPFSENDSITRTANISLKPSVTVTTSFYTSPGTVYVGKNITANFAITNHGNYTVKIGRTKVVVRDQNGNNFDFPSDPEMILNPGQIYSYSKTQALPNAGTYKMRMMNYRTGIGWSTLFPVSEHSGIIRTTTVNVKPSPVVTTSMALTPSEPHADETITASFKITNFGDSPVDIGRTKVVVRDQNGNNFDFPSDPEMILNPGQIYSYSKTQALPNAGTYKMRMMNYRTGIGWSTLFPVSEHSGIIRTTTVNVKPSATVSVGLGLSPANPKVGENVIASFEITNYGLSSVNIGRTKVAVRDQNGVNFDFASDAEMTLAPGQTYIYNKAQSFPSEGTYTMWLVNYLTGSGWSTVFPASETLSIVRSATITVTSVQ